MNDFDAVAASRRATTATTAKVTNAAIGHSHRVTYATLTVGTSSADRADTVDPDLAERRYDFRRKDGRIDVLTADEEWVRFGAPLSGWAAIAVGGQLDVHPRPVQ